MQEVVERMRRVSEDLRQIRKRLDEVRLNEPADQKVVEEVLNLDLVRDFKRSIDEMRLFLWHYFQAAVENHNSAPSNSLQEMRLKRATEMLRSVQEQIGQPMTREQLDVRSLFERLQNIADVTVDRAMSDKDNAEK